MNSKKLVYVFLGAAGSGRREILADLLSDGLAPDDRAAVLLAESESPVAADAALGAAVTRWSWADGVIEAALPPGATHVFFVTDGLRNPVDQLEALKPWLAAQGAELANVICVVNCRLAEQHPPLLAWYDACVHFADAVLFNRREGVANKWISDFQARYKNLFYPCLFEFVKEGRVKNPALLLDPQPRRMSHYFEDEADWIVSGVDEEGDDVADEEDIEDGEEEVTATVAEDPYLARYPSGRRVKELPDITQFLTASESK